MAELSSITLQCETVTPLFLGGADPRGTPELRAPKRQSQEVCCTGRKPRGTPELRAPSLRGALRYWFRALLAETDLSRLQQREAAVFGSQNHASPLSIRVSFAQSPPVRTWDPPRWPPGPAGGGGHVNGLVYLGFAFRPTRGQPARQAIDAGWRFQVVLSARHDDVLRQALAAFWALLHAGGLGSRTRRGFGTIRIVAPSAVVPSGIPALMSTARTPEELAQQLADGLRAAREAVRALDPAAPPAYAALAPGVIEATVLGHVWPSWDAAVADIGQFLAEHRRLLSPTMRELLATTPSSEYPRAGFGLPIVYYNLATGQSFTLEATRISRRASPLWIRPLYLAPGQYAVVLWLSRAPFWPAGSRLQVAGATLHGDVSLNGIEQFIAACTARWSGHGVKVE